MEKRGQHDTSGSDSETSLPDLACKACGMGFSSIQAYESHMKSKKHIKKVAEAKFMSKHAVATKNDESENKSDGDDDTNELYCEVCDKYFSGHVSLMAHLKGSVHGKYLKKQKLKDRLKGMPELLDKENKENSDDEEDDGIIQKPFARCSTCQKEFSGVESFALHMKSTVHKKKAEQLKKLDTLKEKYHDELNLSDGEELPKCDVCQKSFSGPIPYHIHMKSSVHKKNLEKKKIANDMKEFYSKDELETGYVCKECKKAFTDPVSFKHHLTNNSHEKQKAKSALKEFLNAFPEIAFVTAFDEKNAEDEKDSDDSDQDYYLICKICHTSFSGPESAKDHVKSKKHINLKKDKQMRKLLKDQKKQMSDSEKSSDKKILPNSNEEIKKSVLKNGGPRSSTASNSDQMNGADDFELI